MKYVMGIDPGKSGAVAVLSLDKSEVYVHPFKEYTEHDLCEVMREWSDRELIMCYLEKVHSMPRQGVVSTFTFGKNVGWYTGVLDALRIPYDLITPQQWQKAMKCLSKGDKNVTKRRAQQLFPRVKMTHAVADALLIAEHLRRLEIECQSVLLS